MRVSELLFKIGLTESIGQGRRLIIQGHVYIDEIRIRNIIKQVILTPGMTIRIGTSIVEITKEDLKKEI